LKKAQVEADRLAKKLAAEAKKAAAAAKKQLRARAKELQVSAMVELRQSLLTEAKRERTRTRS
jgi:hypothetical protein